MLTRTRSKYGKTITLITTVFLGPRGGRKRAAPVDTVDTLRGGRKETLNIKLWETTVGGKDSKYRYVVKVGFQQTSLC